MGLKIWNAGTDGTNGTIDVTVLYFGGQMNFSFFCHGIYPALKGFTNVGQFVNRLFSEGGSDFFPTGPGYDKEYSYQRKLYAGTQNHLSKKLKESFPNPINRRNVSEFLKTRFDEDKLPDVMNYFGIPESVKIDNEILAETLADQFELLIRSNETEVSNLVASEYLKRLDGKGNAIEIEASRRSRYKNDGASVITSAEEKNHIVSLFEKVDHHWEILNEGSQTWLNRALVFVQTSSYEPIPEDQKIVIEKTEPGKRCRISTAFSQIEFEGRFTSVWKMVDGDGQNCFENRPELFNVIFECRFEG